MRILPLLVIVSIVVGPVRAAVAVEPQAARQAAVQQATFSQTATAESSPQAIQFGGRPTRVGDQTEQTISLDVRLMLTMRRASELLGKHQSTVRTNQRRTVTTTAVDGGRAMAVTVRYPEATKHVADGQPAVASPAPQQPGVNDVATPQPVQGKTYLCHREPGEDGKLIVTDEWGNPPPTEEYEIVSQQMEMVGRPNPLAKFLSGRTITVGEKLEVPKEIAAQIFNLGDKFGEVTQFTLTLQKTEHHGEAMRAVFLAAVEAASSDSSQMRLQVEGPLVVHVDSCRAARIGLVGPIGMSETRGSYSTAYQVIGTGRLQLNIASVYRESQQ